MSYTTMFKEMVSYLTGVSLSDDNTCCFSPGFINNVFIPIFDCVHGKHHPVSKEYVAHVLLRVGIACSNRGYTEFDFAISIAPDLFEAAALKTVHNLMKQSDFMSAISDTDHQYAVMYVGEQLAAEIVNMRKTYDGKVHAATEKELCAWCGPLDEIPYDALKKTEGNYYVTNPAAEVRAKVALNTTAIATSRLKEAHQGVLDHVLGRGLNGVSLVLAGGSVRRALTGTHSDSDADFDVWTVGANTESEARDRLIEAVSAISKHYAFDVYENGHNMTLVVKTSKWSKVKVQFIYRGYQSIHQVLASFDYSSVRAAYDGTDFIATHSFAWAARNGKVVIDPLRATTANRAYKQFREGYDVVVPESLLDLDDFRKRFNQLTKKQRQYMRRENKGGVMNGILLTMASCRDWTERSGRDFAANIKSGKPSAMYGKGPVTYTHMLPVYMGETLEEMIRMIREKIGISHWQLTDPTARLYTHAMIFDWDLLVSAEKHT